MNIINPISIDSQVFQYVMENSLALLGKRYYSDLYYTAIHIHKIFKQWDGIDPLEYWLIVRRDRIHLTTDSYTFGIKRSTLYSQSDEEYLCYHLSIVKSSEGWQLLGEPLPNK